MERNGHHQSVIHSCEWVCKIEEKNGALERAPPCIDWSNASVADMEEMMSNLCLVVLPK